MQLLKRIKVVVLALALLSALLPTNASADVVRLDAGWEYRLGQSPVDAAGDPVWLYDESSVGWHAMTKIGYPDERNGENWIWYRTRLPANLPDSPALYIQHLMEGFEAYVDGELIKKFGHLGSNNENKYASSTIQVISLPQDAAGKMLVFQIYSEGCCLGIQGGDGGVYLGQKDEAIRFLALDNAATVVLGVLFMFLGVFALASFFVRLREDFLAPLAFAAFAIPLGLFYVLIPPGPQYILNAPVQLLYVRGIAFLLFAVGLYTFIRLTLLNHSARWSRHLMTALIAVHAITAAVVVALDITGHVRLPNGVHASNKLFMYTVPTAVIVTAVRAFRGSADARVLMSGFIVFGLVGILDLLQGLQVIPYFAWVSQWGALVFVMCLGYLLERQAARSHQRLKLYSSELEELSSQLEENNRTLEQKVIERTEDLDLKNKELSGTLAELRETQEQLLMQEKMASLGNLVAGVAHEVNNPIGAVVSASDASARAAEVVQKFVAEQEPDAKARPRKAADILVANNGVIGEAARRVARIVRSLKNFARLDEAEFQRTNIHNGIDSTLTLVKHLLQNRIKVVCDYGDIPELLVYPNELNQVFMNLIVNAIDAIPGDGTITITTRRDHNHAVITVADTGTGIAAEDIGRIFDPGFTRKGVGVGTGLGLSISYRIIDKHEGTLSVTSEPGNGAVFTVRLPIRDA